MLNLKQMQLIWKHKTMFLDDHYTTEKTRYKAELVFKQIAKQEAVWERDYSLVSTEQLQSFFDEMVSARRQRAEEILSVLREYVKWRENNKYPFTNAVFEIKVDSSSKMRSCMVSSPYHLKRIIDIAFKDMLSSDCIYAAYLWLSFIGFDEAEAVTLTRKNIDFKGMVINYNNRKYPIYQEACDAIRDACDLTEFRETHNINGSSYDRYIQRRDGDEILRGKRNLKSLDMSEAIYKTFRPSIARRFAEAKQAIIDDEDFIDIDLDITPERVYTSGLFYRAFEKERMGITVDFKEDAFRDVERLKANGRVYKNRAFMSAEAKQKSDSSIDVAYRRAKEYLTDYQTWKKAFSSERNADIKAK